MTIGDEDFKDMEVEHEKIDVFMEYNLMDEAVLRSSGGRVIRPGDQEANEENSFSLEDNENEWYEERNTAPLTYDELSEARLNHVFRRNSSEDCLSEDDHDFLSLFPDSADPKYMELTIKLIQESKRRQMMS